MLCCGSPTKSIQVLSVQWIEFTWNALGRKGFSYSMIESSKNHQRVRSWWLTQTGTNFNHVWEILQSEQWAARHPDHWKELPPILLQDTWTPSQEGAESSFPATKPLTSETTRCKLGHLVYTWCPGESGILAGEHLGNYHKLGEIQKLSGRFRLGNQRGQRFIEVVEISTIMDILWSVRLFILTQKTRAVVPSLF